MKTVQLSKNKFEKQSGILYSVLTYGTYFFCVYFLTYINKNINEIFQKSDLQLNTNIVKFFNIFNILNFDLVNQTLQLKTNN